MKMRSLLLIFGFISGLAPLIGADEPEKEEAWDVNAEHGPTKDVRFATTEGTWLNLDVSPDGKEVVFDLLGDLYIMPITGGKARLLVGDAAMDLQPRFSPDGSRISFTSDRGGGDNIWVMNRDGSELKPVSNEDYRLLDNAVWTPDGQYLIARKHFTSTRSLGAGELWMYHVSGGGGLQLTKRKNDQQDAGEPAVSPDGRLVYFSEDMSPGPIFRYNKDPNGQIYVVRELDRETGQVRNLISGNGGSARPQPSPDGRTIAFIRRVRAKTVLFLYDRDTGSQTPIYEELSHDQQEAWAIFGVYPNFAWTPDGNAIVFWAAGKIRRLDLTTKQTTIIAFEAEIHKKVTRPLRFEQKIGAPEFKAKMIRDAATSPDGTRLVFHAVGHIWKKKLPDGKPERLTAATHFEYAPQFSPDGKTILYASWSDEQHGGVWKTDWNGKNTKKLTERPGFYYEPRFSPDGKKIVFRRGSGNALIGFIHGVETGLYVMDANGGEPKLIREDGADARFNAKGDRIYFQTGGGLEKQFRDVRLDGGDERIHFNLKYAQNVTPSPDGEWVAFTELFQAYIAPFPRTGAAVELSKDTRALPVKQVSKDAGDYLHWSGDGKKLHWMIGPEYHTRRLRDSFSFLDGAPEELPPVDLPGVDVGLSLKSDAPTGKIAFTGARIITMKGDEVIESGDLVVEENRIAAVGRSGSIAIPDDAKIIDMSGKTIMPGLIDVHAHNNHFYSGMLPQQNWSYLTNLAYGVTTGHDPSANSETVFSLSELVKHGTVTGPRIFSTGTILYGADGAFRAIVNNLDDAKSHLRRLKALGAFSVKNYNQPRRNQRQQILKAARELEMLVVYEGGSTFFHNQAMLLDGPTGIEHNLPVAPLYKDVLELWAATEVGYTPTLVVCFAGISGEYYWYQHTNVWEQERLLRFHPRPAIDARSRRRLMLPDNEFYHIEVAKAAKALTDRGGKVNIGAHGQLQGLAAHWEIWMLAQGGMTPHEALRAATFNGAYYLGLDHELGSLEPGKLADLIVLAKNPLENIRHSDTLERVMVNGRLFDANTLNEVGNHPRERAPLYWERDPGGGFQFGSDFDQGAACSCGRH